jgi:plasmid stability protein
MASLIVRGLEEALVARLKARAARTGRSVEAEHRRILREALDSDFDDLAAAMRALTAGRAHTPSEELLRAMRDERGGEEGDGGGGHGTTRGGR